MSHFYSYFVVQVVDAFEGKILFGVHSTVKATGFSAYICG